jgi:Zn-dependent protease with chaperone function
MMERAFTVAVTGLAALLCMLVAPIPGRLSFAAGPAAIAATAGLAVLAAGFAWRGYRHQRLTGGLRARARPASLAGIAVHELDEADAAFVAGLLEPQIFCSPELTTSLASDELRAVLLHERHHQLDRAPAKLVLLETLAPLVGRLRGGADWLERRVAELEIAADRHAIRQGGSRPALARALLKLASAHSPTGVGIGFGRATDLRLRALLTEEDPRANRLPVAWLVAPVVAAAGCLFVALPG